MYQGSGGPRADFEKRWTCPRKPCSTQIVSNKWSGSELPLSTMLNWNTSPRNRLFPKKLINYLLT